MQTYRIIIIILYLILCRISIIYSCTSLKFEYKEILYFWYIFFVFTINIIGTVILGPI
jgi:hypothetical protein